MPEFSKTDQLRCVKEEHTFLKNAMETNIDMRGYNMFDFNMEQEKDKG